MRKLEWREKQRILCIKFEKATLFDLLIDLMYHGEHALAGLNCLKSKWGTFYGASREQPTLIHKFPKKFAIGCQLQIKTTRWVHMSLGGRAGAVIM